MGTPPATEVDAVLLSDPLQLRALASTTRQELVDTLQALGSASVPELARQLARPADALYYHVRALEQVGLLRRVGSRQAGRHVEAVYATVEPDKRLKLQYRADPESTRALQALVASMLRASRRQFDAAITDPACAVEGPRRELWAGRVKGWLAPAELERANQLLGELVQLFCQAQDATRPRLYSLQFLLAPDCTVPASTSDDETEPAAGAATAPPRPARPGRAKRSPP